MFEGLASIGERLGVAEQDAIDAATEQLNQEATFASRTHSNAKATLGARFNVWE